MRAGTNNSDDAFDELDDAFISHGRSGRVHPEYRKSSVRHQFVVPPPPKHQMPRRRQKDTE